MGRGWRTLAGRTALAAGVLSAVVPVARAEAKGPSPVEPLRISEAPVIDGILDDQAWKGDPLPLGEWLTYNPLNGSSIEQKTEVRAAYDDKALYFAFHCVDPDPSKIRGSLSRRDQLFNDDWVGLSLDSVGNGQASYDHFVNPRGVQADVLTTPSAGENSAPDWIWESAGRRTEQGYDVEIRLPLTSLRFKSGDDVKMGVLFWRRVSRLGMSASWPNVPAGKSFIDSHAPLVLHALHRPLTLEMIPSVTYSWNEARVDPSQFGKADSSPDAGLSVKYGLTSAVTLEGTFNPDFSQVESDTFQVEVNQRFPIYFSEKRPFFMEGMGTFELAGAGGDAIMRTAVHTRRIVDPRWGGKATGSAGRLTFATLSAGDEAPGLDPDAEGTFYFGQQKLFNLARAVYSLGPSSYVGALLTDTEFGRGHNRVAAADFSLKRGRHAVSGTFTATGSEATSGLGKTDGLGGQAFYGYEDKRFSFANQFEHYDRDFQMDTAFINQTGITSDWTYAAYSLYPDQKKHTWLKRVVPFAFTRFGRDEIQGGDQRFYLAGVRMHFTRQGFFRVDGSFGKEPWAGQTFDVHSTRLIAEGQPVRWLNLNAYYSFGQSVYYDATNPFVGHSRNLSVGGSFQPSSRFNQTVSWDHASFDRLTGEPVYAVDVLNLRSTFLFDRHFLLRAIVQYDSSKRQVLTDVLGSFELRPGTVVYVGYGSSIEQHAWDGALFQQGRGDYRTMQRGFFCKASYSHRF
jgi:hypothetical protein